MSLYEKAWQAILARIAAAAAAAGRNPAEIRLLAVSKSFPPDAVRAAYALGQRAFGENYVQEAISKADALADLPDVEWHMIGPLQSNKARLAARRFAWIETVDRLRIAERLAERHDPQLPRLDVCVQVNISGEASKSGAAPRDAVALAEAIARLPRLALRGFMGIARAGSDGSAQREQFRALRRIFEMAQSRGLRVDTLSMGMSDDLEAAIAEGSTQVRIGSALFGPRS
ncbi:MAG: YggS family pyridoxal phosphate-dependent enzyme [Betaproteobacteria bacterium]|nr:MAG: YggS family pyridoxal phosphate-dependent enzyme [Betaproteobacteria bacterium]